MGRARMVAPVEPRLLNRTEAAAYCCVGQDAFERLCPVRPISLADTRDREDKRLRRWDRFALDEWIDRVGGRLPAADNQDWLSKVG